MKISSTLHIQAEPLSYVTFRDVASKRKVDPLTLPFTQEIDSQINHAIDESGLVILGEVHGICENAEVVYTLCKRFGIESLGMEWKPETELTISALMLGQQFDPGRIPDAGYGNVTAEYLAVIRQLFEEGMLKKIVLFDRPLNLDDQTVGSRDRAMASNILENLHSSSRMLAVMGNVHTMTETFLVPEGFKHAGSVLEPVAMRLQRELSPISIIDINYNGGSRFGFNIIDGECKQGVHRLAGKITVSPSPDLVLSAEQRIKLTLHDVRAGTCI